MSSIAFAEGVAAYDALDGALDKIAALDRDTLSRAERMALLDRHESGQRRPRRADR